MLRTERYEVTTRIDRRQASASGVSTKGYTGLDVDKARAIQPCGAGR